MKRIRSAAQEQTHITITVIGPDSKDIMGLLQDTLRRENIKRAKRDKPRVSYQMETAALVLAVQGRRKKDCQVLISCSST